jgi:hypothetical protein
MGEFDDGPDDDGPEELEAGGFETPEPSDDSDDIEAAATIDEPRGPEPSASDPEDGELQRDRPESDDEDLQ